jgi:CRP-like cAMP-binding protein
MEVLRDVGLPREWPAGAVLFRQGEPANEVIAIGSGRVRLSSVLPSGLATTIEDSGAGDVLGEFDVLRNQGYGLTAVALERTTGVVTNRIRFREALMHNPGYMLELLEKALKDRSAQNTETEKELQLRRFEEEQVRFDVFRSALANGDEAVLRLHFARHPQDLPKFLSLLEAAPQDRSMLQRLEALIDEGLLERTSETATKQPVL